MKLTKANIDQAQAVLEEMHKEGVLECINYDLGDGTYTIYHEGECVGEADTFYDAYIIALHAQAGTEPPPF